MRSSRTLTAAVVVALGVVVGAVVVAVVADAPASFGWFAYSPLSTPDSMAEVFGNAVLLSHVQVVALLVAAVALAATTGLLGYALGRRVSGRSR